MYATTLGVRSVLRTGLLYLLVSTGNPFFGVVLLFVVIGIGLTGTSYLLDRREASSAPA